MVEGHLQDFTTLAAYLKKFSDDQFLEAMSDLHVLIYIAAMDMLPLRVFHSFIYTMPQEIIGLAMLLLT